MPLYGSIMATYIKCIDVNAGHVYNLHHVLSYFQNFFTGRTVFVFAALAEVLGLSLSALMRALVQGAGAYRPPVLRARLHPPL